MPKINKNVVLIIGLVIVAAAGYYTFTREPSNDAAITVTAGTGTPIVGQELVIELNRLKSLRNLNTDILSDPIFISLTDFTQPVPSQPTGRLNPFAPVGSDI